jgi:hypothetical protein
LHGLIDEDEHSKLKNGSQEEDDCDGHANNNVIGNSKGSSKRDLRAEFKNSSRKSERVLSRVFKKIMIKTIRISFDTEL